MNEMSAGGAIAKVRQGLLRFRGNYGVRPESMCLPEGT
jgi:hypothetical protein